MLQRVKRLGYPTAVAVLWPLNLILSILLRKRYRPGSVLHVSYMGHVPYQTVQILRSHGVDAHYLAVGHSAIWSEADYRITPSWLPPVTVWREFLLLWSVIARHEIIHSHFMVTATRTGWELPWLRRMGRKLVVHFRGCEIRDRSQLMASQPTMNICQECDYTPRVCEAEHNVLRRQLAAKYADAALVTTPDLLAFAPSAEHMPFFAPTQPASAATGAPGERPFRIVHATNHPGIEGTRRIREAVEQVRAKGFNVELQVLTGVRNTEVLAALANADLAIGKMKMGYYANAQIESLVAGVPTITHVRPEFMTEALQSSGFIFATLDSLPSVLEYYLSHPEALAEKRALARESILNVHDNAEISRRYMNVYRRVSSGR